MRDAVIVAAALLSAPASAASSPVDLFQGTFTNEEQVYFEKEAGRTPPAWFALRISSTADGLLIEEPDAFGAVGSAPHPLKLSREGKAIVLDYGSCQRIYGTEKGALIATGVRGTCRAPATMSRIDADGITLTFPGGKTMLLRRARAATCWASLRKDNPKPDGSEDWYFVKDVKLHDQGGRAFIGKDIPDVKPAIVRMRNVTWTGSARASNRPSLVLYVHTSDQPDRAVSYAWSDPRAVRLGINLRWMQASCTLDGLERVGGQ